jgi:hypothetical protein
VRRCAPLVAADAFLIGPERDRSTDDGSCGGESEVAAVEAVADVPIHEEKLAVADHSAALPDGQIAAEAVALQRLAHLDPVHRDRGSQAANPLSRQADDALQQRDAARDIAALGHEGGERFGRYDGDQLGHLDSLGRLDGIEADGCAGRRVPDEFHGPIDGAGGGDADGGERRHREGAAARHGSILRR